MRCEVDLNKLRDFAKENGISIKINYWESSDEYEIETVSAAKNECFYMKRCHDDKYFIEKYNRHLNDKEMRCEVIRHANPDEIIKPAEFIYAVEGMGMTHNYLCAVCREKSAVINCNTRVLMPCWTCQKLGFNVVRTNKIITWILTKIGAMV